MVLPKLCLTNFSCSTVATNSTFNFYLFSAFKLFKKQLQLNILKYFPLNKLYFESVTYKSKLRTYVHLASTQINDCNRLSLEIPLQCKTT